MPTATVTSKGQITLPKEVRDRLELRAGDRLDFVIHADGSVALRKPAVRVSEVLGAFAHRARHPASVADMDQALADKVRKRVR